MSSITLTDEEKISLVEKFFDGVTLAESSFLRLTATDAELLDIDKLVKQTARMRLSNRSTRVED